MRSSMNLSAALAALALSVACGASQGTATTVGTTPAEATTPVTATTEEPTSEEATAAAPAPAPRMTDGQIGEVIETVDKAEIRAGKLAKERSQNPAVRKLAAEMVEDHRTSHDDAGAYMLRATIRPEKSDLSRSLAEKSDATIDHLETLSGAAFDRAFVDSQVAMHEEMIDTVDRVLLGDAVNEYLEATVADLRPVQAAHLQQAVALQAELGPP